MKYRIFSFLFFLLIGLGFFHAYPASANSVMKGTFVDATYEEVRIDDETTEKRLKSITIKNSEGRTTTLPIDVNASFTVDTIPTTIDAFKSGMEVEAVVNLRRVKALSGLSGEYPGELSDGEEVVTGIVTEMDPNGRFLTVKQDNGKSDTYSIDGGTEVFKGTTFVDLSVLFEGDRVKLSFSEYDTSYVSSIEVIAQGVKVENLHRAKIFRIDPVRNTLMVKNEKVFRDWRWQNKSSTASYAYSAKTPVYVGNKLISRDRMRFYANNEVYFATVSQYGKQVIERMIVKTNFERSYYEPMRSVNLQSRLLGLWKSGSIPYHNGTILIRNGRLIDSKTLAAYGTAFVVTGGVQKSQYANIIHVTNDGFQSPNLTNHTIYFGQISRANDYQVTVKNLKKLTNKNFWQDSAAATFAFSNDTVAVKDFRSSYLTLVAKNEMDNQIGGYGYFYVTNNKVVGAHIIGTSSTRAQLVSVGRIDSVTKAIENVHVMKVRNVSQWSNGTWVEAPYISRMDIEQATIIREGKVITADDLKPGERVYILHESLVKGRVLLVN
ncbi:hypothetical protein D0469_09700 [Peribacillus saganii]|uniref:S1 motif domain-containing protein n=1 Tax=Peribacillus saganii TaxID=2303992 RepID=A0A372LNR6_9BACI|nr:hypothetical protein [Peribacillus saganii]RFU69340.1 hypothetical protein D0469_09700 [Peribacillus saganii]